MTLIFEKGLNYALIRRKRMKLLTTQGYRERMTSQWKKIERFFNTHIKRFSIFSHCDVIISQYPVVSKKVSVCSAELAHNSIHFSKINR